MPPADPPQPLSADPHVEWLLKATGQELYRWHSVREKHDVVQSICALVSAMNAERAALSAATRERDELAALLDEPLRMIGSDMVSRREWSEKRTALLTAWRARKSADASTESGGER